MTDASPQLTLLLENAGWLRALARGLVRDDERADDLAQEALLTAWGRPPADERSPRGWLAAVLRSKWRESHRREELRGEREAAAARAEALPSAADVVERAALFQRLASLVMQLDEPFRAAVLMHYFDGLAPKEIAEQLDVPEATVRSRLRRGLERLRRRMDAESGGDRSAWMCALAPAALRGLPKAIAPAAAISPSTLVPGAGWILMQTNAKLLVAALAVAGGAWLVPKLLVEPSSANGSSSDARALDAPTPLADSEPPAASGEAAADSSSRHEPDPPASSAAAPAASAAPAPPSSRAEVDRVGASFVTDRPDVGALADLVRELAEVCEVVEGSVATNDFGVVSGRVASADGSLAGTFEVVGDRYHVMFETQATPELEARFFKRNLSIGFQDVGARAEGPGATIQHHPRTNEDARKHLAPGEVAYVGWSVDFDAAGATRSPIAMQIADDGSSWQIGRLAPDAVVTEPGFHEAGAFDGWLRKLRPHAPR